MKRIISVLALLALSLRVATAGLSTGPSGTNNISGTLFSALDATNVVSGMSGLGLINGVIYVPTNIIDGLNYALTNLAVASNKMSVGGGHIILQTGTHYITYPLVYSNRFPAAIEIEGQGIPGANVVYVGPSTNVDVFQFLGNQQNDGCFLHGNIRGVQFSSCYDTTNFIMTVQGAGWLHFDNCSWVPWTIATNNSNRGLAVAEDDVTSCFTNLSGVRLYPGDTGAGVSFTHCYCKWLQNGVYDGTDHMLIFDTYFSVIAKNGGSTGWPTNSLFRLGAAYIRDTTPGAIGQTLLLHNHWTRDHIIILDNTPTSYRFKSVAWGREESPSDYRYVATNGGGGFTFDNFNDSHSAPDASFGIVATTNALNATVPIYSTEGKSDTIALDYLLQYPVFNYGWKVSPQGNSFLTGTNSMRAIQQLVNLDQMSLVVSGAETPYNGTWVFKEQDQRFVDRANWRTVWTNATTPGTNTIVYDPLSGLPWGLYNVTNDVDNVVYFNEAADTDPPQSSWSPNTGTSNSITVTAVYGKFSVFPTGDVAAKSFSGSGSGITNIPSDTITSTNWLLNTVYSNSFGRIADLNGMALLQITNATLARAELQIMADQSGGSTFAYLGGLLVTNSFVTYFQLPFHVTVAANARFYLTNTSAGNNLVSIVSGTGQFIPLSKR